MSFRHRFLLAGALAVRVLLVLLIAVLAFFAYNGARAADLPVKVPATAAVVGYPYASNGFYFGLNTIGGAGSATAVDPVLGINPNSLTVTQASIGGTVGYVWASANAFYAVELLVDVTNLNGSQPGLSLGGPVALEQRVKIGTPLNNFLNIFPSFNLPPVPPFPVLPGGVVASNVHPYLMAGLHEDDVSLNFGLGAGRKWRIAPSVGMGLMGQLTNGVAIDTWVETRFPTSQFCVVGAIGCVKQGQAYLVGLGLYY